MTARDVPAIPYETEGDTVFRIGCYRAIVYIPEGGISVESFSARHNGHPQGDWLVAHEDEHEHRDAVRAIRLAQHWRDNVLRAPQSE